MHFDFGVNPSLTVALALAAGIIAQSIARHLRLPGIVILLGVGVLLGPDVLGVLDPHGLGNALHILVEFAVAVILFEGGLNLDWRRLRRQGGTIRRLVTLGALITALGGTLAAKWILGWEWRLAVLFGTLVVVTGPTVITPLLRRIKVKRNIETILEAEGVFIDAVGAILAVVALEIVLSPSGSSIALGFAGVPSRLVFGAVFGVIGGITVAFLLRFRGVVPEGLENVFTLSLALALYQTSNMIMPESGIMTVITAGLVVGNMKAPVIRELKEFKEQLTVMLIGMLFVLLAADVRLREVTALGWSAVWVVVALMFVVRPLCVVGCTMRAGMNWRERSFLSWLGPRGIVAAAMASLFYERLSAEGIPGGQELRALVFTVIAITVVFQGMTGGYVARWLGVRRPSGRGYVILGANSLGRVMAKILQEGGQDVVLTDASTEACREAEAEGFRVVYGNALEERVLLMTELESRTGAMALLTNEAVSLLFAGKAHGEYKVPKAYVAIQKGHGAIDPVMIHEQGATVLFGEETDLELWSVRIRRGITNTETWRFAGGETENTSDGTIDLGKEMQNALLPLAVRRGGGVEPVDDKTKVGKDQELVWLLFEEKRDASTAWLRERGWQPVQSSGHEQESE